ncbi:MAG: hypothetical protein JWM32_1151 [Verrucomicrobia bacterium]|nr:hypothetical protein [Verrucomicrobiota bacterium]
MAAPNRSSVLLDSGTERGTAWAVETLAKKSAERLALAIIEDFKRFIVG